MGCFKGIVVVGSTLLSAVVQAYLDHGEATLPQIFDYIQTIPHYLNHVPSGIDSHPSMITAIAPTVTMYGNGSVETIYSMRYNRQAPQKKLGRGIFERGVFASDPPLPTCVSCDANGNAISTSTAASNSTSSGGPTCTTIPYSGVFRAPDPAATSYCFSSSYSGVFTSTKPYSYQLPCCFTIPDSCKPRNSSSSTSMTFTSGPLAISTTFVSNFTTSTFFASPSSSLSLSFPSLTSSLSVGTSSRTTSSLSTRRSSSTTSSSIGTNAPLTASRSSSSSSSRSSLTTTTTTSSVSISTISSVIVISSTTITIAAPSTTTAGLQTSSTLTIITVTPSTTIGSGILGPNTAIGCGTATSGCGTAIGFGTVYLAPNGIIPVVSSGTAIGCAPTVVGCGTLIATRGTFVGTATIIGCGDAYGTATMVGEGTVWPAIGGGLVSFTSSGTLVGSGRVKGCGTLTGSGTYTITGPYPPLTSARPTRTVEVYVSYCPTTLPGGGIGLPRFGANLTSPYPGLLTNGSSLISNTTSASNSSREGDDWMCRQCPNSGGICCPPDVKCDEQGKCPWEAIKGMGYIVHGLNGVMARNLSDGSVKPVEELTSPAPVEGGNARLSVPSGVGSVLQRREWALKKEMLEQERRERLGRRNEPDLKLKGREQQFNGFIAGPDGHW